MTTEQSLPAIDFTSPTLDMMMVKSRWNHYLTLSKERHLSPEETAEAIACTRALRRTNTGPARHKEKPTRETKASKQAAVAASLLDD